MSIQQQVARQRVSNLYGIHKPVQEEKRIEDKKDNDIEKNDDALLKKSIEDAEAYYATSIYNKIAKSHGDLLNKGGYGSGRHRMSVLEQNKSDNKEIGKTKSGKKIYSHSNAFDHTDYSETDHKDAIREHMKKHDEAKKGNDHQTAQRHLMIARTHAKSAGILN